MDLHSPQIQGFFKIPVDHLYAMPVLVDYFRAKEIPDLVVASPDVGFGKQAYKFGEMMHAPVVFGNKTRRGHDEKAEMLDIVGQVERQERLDRRRLHDHGRDLDRDGHRLQEARRQGHLRLRLARRFLRGSAAKIAQSPIKELVLTDTIEYRFEPLAPCCKIVSVARLFAEAIHLDPPPRERQPALQLLKPSC